ncbi:hypothetical protein [Serratia marcescens]|uniref:hypothetical protein n=1 Tax=Serratia marcescens TaxID=615 RepID=UPI0034E8E0A9
MSAEKRINSELAADCEALKAERDAQQKRADALAMENAELKLSRETLAKNALETCNDVFSAGFHSPALWRGLMESTGNRNTYPNPILALVNEAVRELDAPATSAALAAIQAQGVEMAAVKMQESGAQTFGDCYIALVKYANELREAK